MTIEILVRILIQVEINTHYNNNVVNQSTTELQSSQNGKFSHMRVTAKNLSMAKTNLLMFISFRTAVVHMHSLCQYRKDPRGDIGICGSSSRCFTAINGIAHGPHEIWGFP